MKLTIVFILIASVALLNAAVYNPNIPALDKFNDDFNSVEIQYASLLKNILNATNRLSDVIKIQNPENQSEAIQQASFLQLLNKYQQKLYESIQKEGTLKEYSSQIKSDIRALQKNPKKSAEFINDLFDTTSKELTEYMELLTSVKRNFNPNQLQDSPFKPIADQAIITLNNQIDEVQVILNRLPGDEAQFLNQVNSGNVGEIDGFINAAQYSVDNVLSILKNANNDVDTFRGKIETIAESLN